MTAVFPIQNDDANIESALESWAAFLANRSGDHELLIVDDAGTDKTSALIDRLRGHWPKIRANKHDRPRGLGPALATGIQAASNPLIFYTLDPAAYRSADLDSLLKWIDKVDLVTGYRVHEDPPPPHETANSNVTPPRQPKLRRARQLGAERALRFLMRWAFGVRLLDPACVFTLIRRECLTRIPIQSTGLFAHAEILAKANFLGAIMAECPVSVSANPVDRNRWEFRQVLGDASRIFANADFGPPVVS